MILADCTVDGASSHDEPDAHYPPPMTPDAILQALQYVEQPAQSAASPTPVAETPVFEAMEELRNLTDPEADPGDNPEAWHLPPPGIHTTGTQLRRRLVTAESIEALASTARPSLLQRLLRRK